MKYQLYCPDCGELVDSELFYKAPNDKYCKKHLKMRREISKLKKKEKEMKELAKSKSYHTCHFCNEPRRTELFSLLKPNKCSFCVEKEREEKNAKNNGSYYLVDRIAKEEKKRKKEKEKKEKEKKKIVNSLIKKIEKEEKKKVKKKVKVKKVLKTKEKVKVKEEIGSDELRCTTGCGKIKKKTEFTVDKTKKIRGHRYKCKICQRERNNELSEKRKLLKKENGTKQIVKKEEPKEVIQVKKVKKCSFLDKLFGRSKRTIIKIKIIHEYT